MTKVSRPFSFIRMSDSSTLRDHGQMRICLLLVGTCLWASSLDDARQTLTEAAHSKEGDLRRETGLALSLVPAKDQASALLDHLVTDKDYQVRVAAVDTFGELNDARRIGLVKTALGDEVPEVAFAAAKALYNLKDPAGIQALRSVYEGETKGRSSYLKKEMRDSMRSVKTPRSAFLFAMKNGVGFVPIPGVGAGYNAVMGVLSDSDLSARAVSLVTVCTSKNPACIEMLETAFDDDDWTVRASAIHIVVAQNLASMEPKLVGLIEDKKAKVRLRAAASYLRIEDMRSAKPAARPSTRKPRATATAHPS